MQFVQFSAGEPICHWSNKTIDVKEIIFIWKKAQIVIEFFLTSLGFIATQLSLSEHLLIFLRGSLLENLNKTCESLKSMTVLVKFGAGTRKYQPVNNESPLLPIFL